jgi:hypothetical protein
MQRLEYIKAQSFREKKVQVRKNNGTQSMTLLTRPRVILSEILLATLDIHRAESPCSRQRANVSPESAWYKAALVGTELQLRDR